MCVCLTINARKKFRIKNLHTLPNKTDGYAAMFLLQCGGRHFCWYHDLPEPQKRHFGRSVETPQTTPLHTRARVNSHPGQLVPGQLSLAPVSTRPLCQLVPESTRPRVNSSPGQLEPGSTRPRVNSSLCQLAPHQLVPESTRPRFTLRLRVNSSPRTRPRVNSRLHLSLVNLHPRQLAPTSTSTLVIPQPSQLTPRSTRTQVPAYHTTHLPIYLHYLPPT